MRLLCSKGQSLTYSPGWGNQRHCVVALYVGEGSERDQGCLPDFQQLSVTSSTTHKWIGPFWCWFLHGWFCVHSNTLWVSLMDSSVSLRVSPGTTTPTDFCSQRFWSFIPPCWILGLRGMSHCSGVPPGLPTSKCGTTSSTSHHLTCPSTAANDLLWVLSMCGCLSVLLHPVGERPAREQCRLTARL